MKKAAVVTVLVAGLTLFGCGTEKQKGCSSYSDATISWNDYNTVDDMIRYFQCQPDTILRHIGDTIKVKGWLYLEDSIYRWDWKCRISGTENYQGNPYEGTVEIMYAQPTFMIWDNPVYYHQQLYITGTLAGGEIDIAPGANHCCDYYFQINSLDTIHLIEI